MRYHNPHSDPSTASLITIYGVAIFVALSVGAAWVTHVMWSIKLLLADTAAPIGHWLIAAAGVIVPPVGIIHGVMLWFGGGM